MLVMMTDIHATTTSTFDVASTVRADNNVNDDSSSNKVANTGSSSNAELRSLNFQDALVNTWDMLTTRTLRPTSSSTANEANDEASASGDSTSSDSETTSTTAAPIKAESLSLSADDAVTEALKTATPTVTPAPVATAIETQNPVPAATLVVTPAPVVTATPTPTPMPSPVQTPAPTPSPSPTASETVAESSTPESGLNTDELVKNVSIKSGSANSSFDETIVVMILGGVGLIGVVVLVMSRKISKETGDDEAIRRASSFGIARL